jgi:small conductance mechanosensitive channel
VVHVPNRYLFQENFINYPEQGKRRLRLACGVSYGEDLQKVERVAIEALRAAENRLQDENVSVHRQGFGNSSIDFIANVWMEYTRNNCSYITSKMMR